MANSKYEKKIIEMIKALMSMRICAEQDREKPIPIRAGQILYKDPKKEDT